MGEVIQGKIGPETVKVHSLILMDERPHEIRDWRISVPGKHGCAKYLIDTKDVFTGRRAGAIFKKGDVMEIPVMKTESYEVDFFENYKVTLKSGKVLKCDKSIYHDMELVPEGNRIRVTVISYDDEYKIVSFGTR